MVSLRLGPRSLGSSIKSFSKVFCGYREERGHAGEDKGISGVPLRSHPDTYQIKHGGCETEGCGKEGMAGFWLLQNKRLG